jgi:hypothetical protein
MGDAHLYNVTTAWHLYNWRLYYCEAMAEGHLRNATA